MLSKLKFSQTENILFLAIFMIGFGVKIPVIPFHF
jgi:NADH:ubiquinone oxidoreductase subunit 4 (subunit M)